MKVIGLTGSIAMGKSTVVKMISQQYRLPVWDADSEVHQMYRTDQQLIGKIEQAFPGVVNAAGVDRVKLLEQLLHMPDGLGRLNDIVHGPLGERGQAFLRRWARQPYVLLDVPLLYEIGWHVWCDVVVVVAAPDFVQEQRLWRRSQFNQTRMRFFIDNQKSSEQKQQLADHVILSGLSKANTCRQIKQIFNRL